MTLELVTTLIGFVGAVAVWSYSTFQTRDSAKETNQHLDRRLEAIEEIKRRLEGGRLDALVNNAGISPKGDGGARLGTPIRAMVGSTASASPCTEKCSVAPSVISRSSRK